MYDIKVYFLNGDIKEFKGNFIIEGFFIRINYDHDADKQTPQRTVVYAAHMINHIESEVIQSGIKK